MPSRHSFVIMSLAAAATSQSVITTFRPLGDGELSTYAVTLPPLPTASPAPPPDCDDCNSKIAGVMLPPLVDSTTVHEWTLPTGDGNSDQGSGVLHAGPTTADGVGVWYRQAWVVPVTWILCIYSIMSCIFLMMLIFNGRLDLRGNLHFGRDVNMLSSNPWIYASARTGTRLSTRATHRPSRQGLALYLQQYARPRSPASVAETHIDYGDDDDDERQAARRAALDALNGDTGPAPQPRAFVRTNDGQYVRYIFQDGSDNVRTIRFGIEGVSLPPTVETERMRRVLGDEEYQAQTHQAQLRDLRRLETSMARAGWS